MTKPAKPGSPDRPTATGEGSDLPSGLYDGLVTLALQRRLDSPSGSLTSRRQATGFELDTE